MTNIKFWELQQMLQITYLTFCILGTILPYSQFILFLMEHGFDFQLFFEQLFSNRIASFSAMDLIVSSVIFWTFVFVEGRRLEMKNLWIYIVSNLLVGVSLALPLFLLMRERKQQQKHNYQFNS